MRHLLLTIFLAVYFVGHSQMDDYQKDIIDLLRINGTVQEYGWVYDEIFESLKVQYAKAEVPEAFWQKLRRDRKARIDELLPDLSFGYRKHFAHQEIKDLMEFYKLEVMQEAVLMQKELREVDDARVKQFATSDLGRKTVAVKPALQQDLDEIASHWRKDIFKQKFQALIRAGYQAGRN